mmetsp:Transcript_43377/g.73180  ORF Transcript_43377/g.73180 Transcript_43377/m.73180 type:complete len:131 (-) Transcript_43377:90-482(-)
MCTVSVPIHQRAQRRCHRSRHILRRDCPFSQSSFDSFSGTIQCSDITIVTSKFTSFLSIRCTNIPTYIPIFLLSVHCAHVPAFIPFLQFPLPNHCTNLPTFIPFIVFTFSFTGTYLSTFIRFILISLNIQ